MSDILKKKINPFTQIPNELIIDNRLTAKAKAIYCYLESRPDDWKFYASEIKSNMKEGIVAVRVAINELIEFGWIEKTQVRIGGKFSHNEFALNYTVLQKPSDGNRPTEPVQQKSPPNNTNKTIQTNNTDNLKTKAKKEAFELFWKAYPKKKSKESALKAFTKHFDLMPPLNEMLNHISMMSMTKDWTKDNGQFIPYPATWLNAHGWNDEVNLSDYEKGVAIQKHLGISPTEYLKRRQEGTLNA